MKICMAQYQPVKGYIAANITKHYTFIKAAVAGGAGMIIFPELSLTGYEPTLAKDLATTKDDQRLDALQSLSDTDNIIICAGLPVKTARGICISMVIFQPGKERIAYSKKYLHADEEPFFVSGENFPVLNVNNVNIAIAICYELSVEAHAETAFKNKIDVYITSVAKTESGIAKANIRLAEIAATYHVPVLMCNCLGPNDDFVGAGNSAAWDNQGNMLAQLNSSNNGLLFFDTVAKRATALAIQ